MDRPKPICPLNFFEVGGIKIRAFKIIGNIKNVLEKTLVDFHKDKIEKVNKF